MSTATLQLAVGSPIVTIGAAWANEGSIEDLAQVAETADRLGYHHLTCSEHIALPASEIERRGAIYWDPLATFGYLAAHHAYPVRHQRPGPAVPPPTRDRQALRHP